MLLVYLALLSTQCRGALRDKTLTLNLNAFLHIAVNLNGLSVKHKHVLSEVKKAVNRYPYGVYRTII